MVRRLASVVGCIACVSAVAVAEPAFQKLSARDVAARLGGMEFTDGVHWSLIFGRGGRLTSVQSGGRFTAHEANPQFGNWQVRGDQLCFGIGDQSRCHEVWVSGASVQLRAVDAAVVDGVLRKPSLSR